MAAKKPRIPTGFVLFDIVYEDGTRTSNRKVPAVEVSGLDKDEPARTFIEEQDRSIGEMSGASRGPIKTIQRSSKAAKLKPPARAAG